MPHHLRRRWRASLVAPVALLVACALAVAAEETAPPAATPTVGSGANLAVDGVEFAALAGSAPLATLAITSIDAFEAGPDEIKPPEGGKLFDIELSGPDVAVFLWQADGEPLDATATYLRTRIGGADASRSHGVLFSTAEGVARLEAAVVAPTDGDGSRDAIAAFARLVVARTLSEGQRVQLVGLLMKLDPPRGREFIDWLWTASGEGSAATRAAAAAAAYALGGNHPERLAALAADDEVGVDMACAAAELAPPPADARAWVLAALARDSLNDEDAARLLPALAKLDAAEARRVGLDWLAHGDAAKASAAAELLAAAGSTAHDDEAARALLARLQRPAHPAADGDADAPEDDRVALLAHLENLDGAAARSIAAEWWRQPMSWVERRAALDTLVRLNAVDAGIIALIENDLQGDDGSDPIAHELLTELGKLDAAALRRVAGAWLAVGSDANRVAAAATALAARGVADAEAAKLLQAHLAAIGPVTEGALALDSGEDPQGPVIAALTVLDPAVARPLALSWVREARPALAAAAAEALIPTKADAAADTAAASAIATRIASLADQTEARGRLLDALVKLDAASSRRALLALLQSEQADAQEEAARRLAEPGTADAEAATALTATLSAATELNAHTSALLESLERLDRDSAARVRKDKGW